MILGQVRLPEVPLDADKMKAKHSLCAKVRKRFYFSMSAKKLYNFTTHKGKVLWLPFSNTLLPLSNNLTNRLNGREDVEQKCSLVSFLNLRVLLDAVC